MKKRTIVAEIMTSCLLVGGVIYSRVNRTSSDEETISISEETLEVYFIDVGQGDSTLIIDQDEAMLIDGGLPAESQKIYSFLEEKNISHLKYIVATHEDSDHVGGLSAALEHSSCDEVLVSYTESDNSTYQTFLSKANEKNVPIKQVSDGDVYQLNEAKITVLGPTDIIDGEVNNNSMVFRLDYKNVSFLFTGDAEQMEQQLILYNHYDELNVDVLKVAHHGSYNAASSAWFQAITPKYSVISCGIDNSYGHPHDGTLELLKQEDTELYRTDLQGTITCITDGNTISFTTEKESSQDVWSTGEKESEDSYVLNTRSKKFHRPSCDNVNSISDKNKEVTEKSREEIINEGYTPCGKCQP